MSKLSVAVGLTVVVLAGGVRSALAQAPAGPERPSSVPQDYQATPFGWFHPSCILELSNDEEVQVGGSIRDMVRGNSRTPPPCSHARFDRAGREVHAQATQRGQDVDGYGGLTAAPLDPSENDWIEYTWHSGVAMSWLSATWIVTSAPKVKSGQTIYLFPGFEPGAYNFILQPVLGWNHRGNDGNRWTIASWNCCYNDNAYHSTLLQVSPGQSLAGYVWGSSCNTGTGVCGSWQVSTSVAGGSSTVLNTNSYGVSLTNAFGGVLETYDLSSCQQLPAGAGVTFSNIALSNITGGAITPSWSNIVAPDPGTASCSYAATSSASTATLGWCIPRTTCPPLQCGAVSDDCGGTINCGCGTGPKCFDENGGWYYAGSGCVSGQCVPRSCE